MNKKICTTKHVGSSETIRKTPLYTQVFTKPFNFVPVMDYIPQHVKHYSPAFLSWFIGFSEGDGSFIVSGNRLFFTITQKDAALLYRIRTQLGFGVICSDRKDTEIKRLTITHRNQIEILIHIFNGNLLLKKTTARFTRWVNSYNKLTGKNLSVISRWSPILELDQLSNSREKLLAENIHYLRAHSVMWTTSWFTGFLEAEGIFYAVQRFKHNNEKKTEMRFILDQTNELEVLSHVRDLLGDCGCIWIRKKQEEKIQYRYSVSTQEALNLIVKYLNKNPLRTKKNIVYIRWKKILNYLELIQNEKQTGTVLCSEKRQKRINRLVLETKKAFLVQEQHLFNSKN